MTKPKRRIEIYDTTLRDGAQGEGVSFSLVDKLKIAQHLDHLGVDFVEGGYPLSNPKDAQFFAEVRRMSWKHARVCAFGMTRRKGISPADDPGMRALVDSGAPVITIVGKTWDLHVDEVLNVSREENLAMICESIAYCREQLQRHGGEVSYDAEHFFDGYRANPTYALATLRAAVEGGATRLILCDTNGGSLPGTVSHAIQQVWAALAPSVLSEARIPRRVEPPGFDPKPDTRHPVLGIHTHNDGGLAVANALAAVEAGCAQVQGTINGIGERCGNLDLTTVIANLCLKMDCDCLQPESLAALTQTSRLVYETANMNLVSGQPYVGPAAFAHKGGMHVHAVQKVAHSYEHVPPQSVGNTRRVLISELSGVSNVAAMIGHKFKIADNKPLQKKVVDRLSELENQGYQFEGALASFELLVRQVMGKLPQFWKLERYRCVIFKSDGAVPVTEATVKLKVGDVVQHRAGEGDGPVNALDTALRAALMTHYPELGRVHLRDYKVRVVNATAESAAKVRVVADFAVRPASDDGAKPPGEGHSGEHRGHGPSHAHGDADASGVRYFSTIGVSENIVDASWQAISDAFVYHLVECGGAPGGES